MSLKYQSIKGMKDVLPSESPKWIFFEKIIVDWMRKYGYEQIRTPILENTNLFIRSIGEATDIVEKEMYSFVDSLNKDALTLRPEGTVACLRACLENNLLYNSLNGYGIWDLCLDMKNHKKEDTANLHKLELKLWV